MMIDDRMGGGHASFLHANKISESEIKASAIAKVILSINESASTYLVCDSICVGQV